MQIMVSQKRQSLVGGVSQKRDYCIMCKIHVLNTKSMIIHVFTLGSHDMAQKKLNSFF